MSNAVADYWSKRAAEHGRTAYKFEQGLERYPFFEVRLQLIDELLRNLPPGRVLDAGCGAGQILCHFLDRGWEGVGVDIVPEMVGLARENLLRSGHDPECVTEGSVDDLSAFRDQEFDLVLSVGVMEYLEPVIEKRAFEEARRVLKDDGTFLVENINQLFDLATFNRFTIDFWRQHLLPPFFGRQEELDAVLGRIQALIAYPEKPDRSGAYTTTRDQVYTKAEIPLIYGKKVQSYGFDEIDQAFYRFHAVPPLLFEDNSDLERRSIPQELPLARHWIGNFLASGFISILKKRI